MMRGSCLCGDAVWEHSGTPQFMGACHIFTGSKAPWHDIVDGLPQFDQYPTEQL